MVDKPVSLTLAIKLKKDSLDEPVTSCNDDACRADGRDSLTECRAATAQLSEYRGGDDDDADLPDFNTDIERKE